MSDGKWMQKRTWIANHSVEMKRKRKRLIHLLSLMTPLRTMMKRTNLRWELGVFFHLDNPKNQKNHKSDWKRTAWLHYLHKSEAALKAQRIQSNARTILSHPDPSRTEKCVRFGCIIGRKRDTYGNWLIQIIQAAHGQLWDLLVFVCKRLASVLQNLEWRISVWFSWRRSLLHAWT